MAYGIVNIDCIFQEISKIGDPLIQNISIGSTIAACSIGDLISL